MENFLGTHRITHTSRVSQGRADGGVMPPSIFKFASWSQVSHAARELATVCSGPSFSENSWSFGHNALTSSGSVQQRKRPFARLLFYHLGDGYTEVRFCIPNTQGRRKHSKSGGICIQGHPHAQKGHFI